MRMKAVLTAALAVAIGYGTAAATPWPGDDTGELTLDKTKSKCEQKASKNVAKLVQAILKCQTKLVDNAFKLKPAIDEQACEAAAEAKFTLKTATADCPCVDPAGVIGIAEPVINANTNLTYCDPGGVAISGLPDNGAAQITGNVPTTKTILVYEDKTGKNVAKLVASFLQCHQKFAADWQKTGGAPTFDEEGCEALAMTAFDNAQAVVAGPGAGCEDLAGLKSLTEAQLEGGNFLTFCESPSGAFVQ